MRLIDADALIEKLEAWKKEAERRAVIINYTFASAIIAQVNAEPTIEERKTGKWIYDYDKNEALFFQQGWKCSDCGRRQTYGESEFCMNCGAKMEHSDGYEERQRKLRELIERDET